MKVLLIAGLSDSSVRKHLRFSKDRKLYRQMIRWFRLPARVGEFSDTVPWVKGIIENLRKRDGIELHVMGPHIRLKEPMEEFELQGVTYHYFRSEWSSLMRKTNKYSIWKHIQRSTYYSKKIIDKVSPDIVVLSGAENPTTSISILSATGYPSICLCQTIYNNPLRQEYGTPNKLIQEVEMDILQKLQYIGVYCKMHYDLLKNINPNAYVFKFGYPSSGKILEPVETEKQYDFVNFAQMHGSRKGTPDSIQALAIVKKTFPKVTLNIVGGCDEDDLIRLKELVKNFSLEENVIFTPFFEKRSDLLLHVQKSRFAVLPCKLDHTSGTMTQSMQLGLPLVVYKTTGTPSFNRKKECALIAEKGNVEELAQHMLTLMENPEKAEMLRKNAREFQEKLIEYKRGNGDRLLASFIAIIDNYHNGIPIPQEQLFNPETDD